MTNCFNFEIPIKSSVFDDLKGTTVSPFVYAVFPSPDVYMEGAMCIRLIHFSWPIAFTGEENLKRVSNCVHNY